MTFPLVKIAARKSTPELPTDHDEQKCRNCGCAVKPTAAQRWKLKKGLIPGIYCSRSCKAAASKRRLTEKCAVCGKDTTRLMSQVRKSKSGKIFCSPECGTIWSNWKGPKFNATSILEREIGEKLKADFPDIEIELGNRTVLDSSVDIWIPGAKVAIEINGPHHYQPLRGSIKSYINTIKNDLRKIRQAQEAGITMYVLDARLLRGKKAFDRYYPQVAALVKKVSE